MSEKKRHTEEQKIINLRELLENNIPISQVVEKYKVAYVKTFITGRKTQSKSVNELQSKFEYSILPVTLYKTFIDVKYTTIKTTFSSNPQLYSFF